MGIFDKLLTPKNFSQATQIMSKGELLALDNYLLQAAKQSNPAGAKLLKSMQSVKSLPHKMINPKRQEKTNK